MKRGHPIFRLHTYLGLGAGVYFVLIGLTGSALVFRPEVERGLITDASSTGEADYAVAAAWRNLRGMYPGYAIGPMSFVQYPGTLPAAPLRVRVKRGFDAVYVYVDARSGRVLGAQHPAIVWLQNLHFNLFGGRIGLLVNAIGALLLVLMCLTGIVVWWPATKVGRHLSDLGRLTAWAAPRGLHRSAGIVSALFLAVVGAGGVYLAWSWYASEGDSSTSWQAGIDDWPVDLDTVLARAMAAAPNGRPLTLVLPYAPGQPFRFDSATGDATVRVLADQRSGQVISATELPPPSFGAQAIDWLSNAHYGRTLGYPNRVLWLALGLMPLLLFCTGIWVWWGRGRAGGTAR